MRIHRTTLQDRTKLAKAASLPVLTVEQRAEAMARMRALLSAAADAAEMTPEQRSVLTDISGEMTFSELRDLTNELTPDIVLGLVIDTMAEVMPQGCVESMPTEDLDSVQRAAHGSVRPSEDEADLDDFQRGDCVRVQPPMVSVIYGEMTEAQTLLLGSGVPLDFIEPSLGNVAWTCPVCEDDVPVANLAGAVANLAEVRKGTLEIDTIGTCECCARMFTFRLRLDGDADTLYLVDGNDVINEIAGPAVLRYYDYEDGMFGAAGGGKRLLAPGFGISMH